MKLRVCVVYGAPGVEASVDVALPAPVTVGEAVAASDLVQRLQLDAAVLQYAIFGQRTTASTLLRDGDRVELTRPLAIDPRSARVARAAKRPR